MDTGRAIAAFSQSEKIKAGLIWVSQMLELLEGTKEDERKGAQRAAWTLLNMVGREVDLAKAVAGGEGWDEISDYIDRAEVMFRSGVSLEALPQVSHALSRTVTIGHRSMSFLKEKGLM